MWPLSVLSKLLLSLPATLRYLEYPLLGFPDYFQAMRFSRISLGGLLSSSALATNLYVSSYGGNITSLQLSHTRDGGYSLKELSFNEGSEPSPSWLTLTPENDVLYCLDEGLTTPNGSIASYKISDTGKMTLMDRHSVLSGPVSSVPYNNGRALVAAH